MSAFDLRPRPSAPIVPVGPYERTVAWLERQGYDRKTLLDRAGISEDELSAPQGFLTLDQVEALALVGAEMVNKPGKMLELGATLLFPSYGNLGLAALTAPSLGHAIHVATKYLELVTPLFVLEEEADEQVVRVRLTARYRMHPEVYRIHLEFVLSTLYGLARNGVGHLPAGARLTVPTDDPRLHQWLSERGVTVLFDPGADTSLELPRALIDSSFVMADAAAHAGFVALCEAAMRDLSPADPMTRRVREALRDSGPPFPTLEGVCRTVGASARTIRRRLREEGTGYQVMLDEARFSWAKRLLQHTARPVTEIAYDLGYSAPSNFTRAFRRALGMSPSAFRSDGTGLAGHGPSVHD